ncbi:MAG: isoleucine--tRNA ligase [Cyanobacteria bacterium P01_F01_bin.150]
MTQTNDNSQTDQASDHYYPQFSSKPNFPEIEREILDFWQRENIFRESVESRSGESQFVFYDGPPFANGLPHYGHLVTGYVKDIIPRYQTLQRKRVERRFGWDCHGLPAEMAAEKDLGISGTANIIEYGIETFNAYCRSSVLKYTQEWEDYVTRQARWVDFQNDYKTMDLSFMESVLWAFKQLWEKGLVYESYRVMPYSWAAESVLSNFETRLDNSYRQRQDPAVTVGFTLNPLPDEELPVKLMAWTTTPWTLPSNLALAVGADITYAVLELNDSRIIVAESALDKYERELSGARRVGSMLGQELAGRQYQPLFPFFQDTPEAFRVLSAEFVNTDEGTGIVHIAPGFGEDDQRLCQDNGIPLVCPVDHAGRFTHEVPTYAGMLVFDANKTVIKDLKQRGIVVRHETYLHNYPHCWRTDEPLIYKAVSSWYVKVSAVRDRMVELNQQINWLPDHIKDGLFGKWLEGAKDWAISRNRFWGTPVPIWKSDNPDYPRIDVYGSLDEIERDFGVRPSDLHRPFIDELVRPNPDDPTGQSMMRRVDEVFDCWFESGSMPFAQVHYPFENQEWFDSHFPGDFIVEYIAQTRGWFYTLMVLGTALFDRPPFLNCICHGVVLDENGQKLSKRLRNYPDPKEVFETQGADALRWFLVSSPVIRGGDLLIDRDGKAIGDVIRLVINPIWNAYYFFCLYANADGVKAEFRADQTGVLDRYILCKTRQLIVDVATLMDSYQIPEVCVCITAYIDVLNNWYIRRSRDRFWQQQKDQDKQDAYDTLFTVLNVLCQVASPLLPCITEYVYKGLTGARSVHLLSWPDAEAFPNDPALIQDMDYVRDICSTALSIREKYNLRVRLPLNSLTLVSSNGDRIVPYMALIEEEINVKAIQLERDSEKFANNEIRIKGSVGARLKGEMPKVMAAAKAGRWRLLDDGRVEVEGHVLEPEEFSVSLKMRDGVVGKALDAHDDGVVVLDTTISPELEREGIARDLVRLIQISRRDADLDIADHIELVLDLPADFLPVIEEHKDYICRETLADMLTVGTPTEEKFYTYKHDLQFKEVLIAFSSGGRHDLESI